MQKLVLMRHGQSQWNLENRFTGWVDIALTDQGRKEAQAGGQLLAKEGFQFDYTYTSVLKRAIHTLWIVLDELDQIWLPVQKSWRLNERHYGALQGLNKNEIVNKHGAEQVFTWRRSYSTPPPSLSTSDPQHPIHEAKYAGIKDLPRSEALVHTQKRVLPLWNKEIAPKIKSGKRVLIVAHGNSLRALIKHLDNISDDKITQLNIPTGIPLIYEFNDTLTPIKNYYLARISHKLP